MLRLSPGQSDVSLAANPVCLGLASMSASYRFTAANTARPPAGGMADIVTGFGCRPGRTARRVSGPASESRQGTESRGVGAAGSAGAMGISLAPLLQRARVDAALDVASGARVDERNAERRKRRDTAIAEPRLSALQCTFGTCIIVAGGEPALRWVGSCA